MPYACIFVPDFSVEALVRVEPDLRSQPMVVLEGKPPLQKVYALNEKARRVGIEPGMTRLQLEACADLVLRPRSTSQEDAAHAALLDCAQSFSPRVEDTATDTLLLDLSGLERLFGPLPRIARDLARRASDLGLEANVAVACNPDTAILAARGFFGVTVIPAGNEADQLGSLPTDVLFAGENDAKEAMTFVETLERWGVRNLRALAALPEVALSERLGQRGLQMQRLARGTASRTLVPAEPPLQFEEAIELEHPVMLLEPLAFLLGRLLEQLCARLGARALATQELKLTLDLATGWRGEEETKPASPAEGSRNSVFHRTLQLPVPLLDPKVFLKLLQLDLKAHPPGAPIVKIRLAAEPVRPRAAQGGLFLPPTPEPEKLELTLVRISGIVGENRVGSLELLDTHHPQGFRMLHFAPLEPEKSAMKTDEPKEEIQGHVTALRIFRPAKEVSVTIRDGKPSHLTCLANKELHGEVLWAAGPWRFSGDWWERDAWARDEWDIAVENESGITLYRLVRDLLAGQWILEGTYD